MQNQHTLASFDTENDVQGKRGGVKAALETWLSIGNTAFVQTDVNWSEVFNTYSGRLRLGYRLNPAFSLGLEGAAVGNANYDAGRGGAFGAPRIIGTFPPRANQSW
jgi:hypothetical protein